MFKVVKMIRTHILLCSLPREEANALNRESGRIYSDTLVTHYRVYRKQGVWLRENSGKALNDSRSGTNLHAHSRDAAQEGFYRACKTANANRPIGGKYPHRRKFYRTTIWKSTGIEQEGDRLRLARAKGLAPIFVPLPEPLASLPPAAFFEMRLVY